MLVGKLHNRFMSLTLMVLALTLPSCSVMNTRFMITVCSEDDMPPLSVRYEENVKHHENYGLILTISDNGVKLHCNNLIE